MKRPIPTKASTLKENGFTLIELIITIAIMAILASIAYPSYLKQIYETRQALLTTNILECASNLERLYTLNNTYTANACNTINDRNSDYTIKVDLPENNNCVTNNGNNSCFTITAIAISAQMLRNNKCRSFSYDHFGVRQALDAQESVNTSKCWPI